MPDEPYEEHRPRGPALVGVVDRVWARCTRQPEREPTRVLPDGCVDVLFELGARPRAFVVGAMTAPRLVPAEPREIVAVRFRPGAAARVLAPPIDALTDAHVPLDALGVDARPLLDALCAAASLDARRAALESFVASQITRGRDPLVERAVARLVSPRPPAVDALARELGVTRQHLARRLRAAVGLTPKQLARIARAQRALASLTGGLRDHAALAREHGYCDQAHLVNELRALTGLTPGAIARAPGSVSPITSAFDVAEQRA